VKRRKVSETTEDKVFELDSSDCYKSELRGHEKSVTALAVLVEDGAFLISGDSGGTLRVWDLESRGCVRVIMPWSFSTRTTVSSESEAAKSSGSHPVTSILVVPRGDDSSQQADVEAFGASPSAKEAKANSIVSLVTPLNRFPDQIDESNLKMAWAPAPFLRPKRSKDSMAYEPLESRLAVHHEERI
jgi:hypothetical protein